ncbi:hypothetical protein IV38_GL000095 [Lactobacillus selangorensis]|uniref:Uncharacterized protein n=1 Tax=Lactobacillus selangorensis TaxID=81857 RepID=A0A0R2FSH2_9LACO|nr:hypothetical protein [Lactobacillus selangorensis]KRN29215.1 hypothetical protein IV38_GL000095 [Lactobacillus selangorensis]KRN31427.1 hypothetical protein IV40_GL001423 [Lactobacillus selangorensis]
MTKKITFTQNTDETPEISYEGFTEGSAIAAVAVSLAFMVKHAKFPAELAVAAFETQEEQLDDDTPIKNVHLDPHEEDLRAAEKMKFIADLLRAAHEPEQKTESPIPATVKEETSIDLDPNDDGLTLADLIKALFEEEEK